MESQGKRSRNSDSSAGNSSSAGDPDRLSALPDCLLHDIMSRLKAQQVVQTCVLGTRWRHLWRSVPCLDIDQAEFGVNKAAGSQWESFEDFTDHLLTNNIAIAALDTLGLHVANRRRGKGAARWIRHGIKYNNTRQTDVQRDLASPGRSWRLKRLHLSNLRLDRRFAAHVSSGCKFLEDLEMKGCKCGFPEITSDSLNNLTLRRCVLPARLAITVPNLKSLVINCGGHIYPRHDLLVTAPSATNLLLALSVYMFENVSLEVMPSLATASISLRHNSKYYPLYKDQVKLLGTVSTVTSLELSGFKKMDPLVDMAFPEFKNLRALRLHNCDLSDDFQMLRNFFQGSPNLEKLTLRHCKLPKHSDTKTPLDSWKKTCSTKQKRKASSPVCRNNVEDFYCENLNLTEIIYKDEEFSTLVEYLSRLSGNLPKNTIELIKLD